LFEIIHHDLVVKRKLSVAALNGFGTIDERAAGAQLGVHAEANGESLPGGNCRDVGAPREFAIKKDIDLASEEIASRVVDQRRSRCRQLRSL
jgi:hypothetical protein